MNWLANLFRKPAVAPAAPKNETLTRTDWRGYVPTSAARLADALPEQAHAFAGAFVTAGEECDLNPLFLAAISRHETAGWTSYAFRVKRNAMGISDAHGPVYCPSYGDSIRRMAKSLANPSGYYRGCRSLEDVWYVYSPPSFKQADGKPVGNDPHDFNKDWGPSVLKYWRELEAKVA